MGGTAKRTYIVAWTVANAEAPMVEAVEMTDTQAAEIERALTFKDCFPTVVLLDTLRAMSPRDFAGLKRMLPK